MDVLLWLRIWRFLNLLPTVKKLRAFTPFWLLLGSQDSRSPVATRDHDVPPEPCIFIP